MLSERNSKPDDDLTFSGLMNNQVIVTLRSGIQELETNFSRALGDKKKEVVNLVSALNNLVCYVENEIEQMRKSKKSNQEIDDSRALFIARCASTLVNELRYPNRSNKCWFAIDDFERDLMPVSSRLSHAGKIIAAVVIAAIVALGCAFVGGVIGLLLTSWSGPGAAAGAFTGAVKGGMIGWQLGVVIGASALGIAAGGISLYGFFKKNEEQRLISDTVVSAKKAVDEASNPKNNLY